MRTIYKDDGYHAQISGDGTCVVHRSCELPRGQKLHTHVGEKKPDQHWSKISLMGCPNEIRVKIIAAWKKQLTDAPA